MDLDQQAVGPGGNRGQGHWSDEIAATCTLAGIRDNWQVREMFDERNGTDVHSVARDLLEGADTALTKDDIAIALRKNILSSQQPLFNSCRHAAFEHDRLANTSDLVEEH